MKSLLKTIARKLASKDRLSLRFLVTWQKSIFSNSSLFCGKRPSLLSRNFATPASSLIGKYWLISICFFITKLEVSFVSESLTSSKISIILVWFSAEILSLSVCSFEAFTNSLHARFVVMVWPVYRYRKTAKYK